MWLHSKHGWWPSDTTRLAVSPASKQMWGCHCLRYAHSFAPPAGWPYYVSHHKSLTHNLSQSLRLNVKMRSAGCGKKKLKFLPFLCSSKMCVSHFLVHAPQWLVRLTTSSKSHPISQLPRLSLIQPPIFAINSPIWQSIITFCCLSEEEYVSQCLVHTPQWFAELTVSLKKNKNIPSVSIPLLHWFSMQLLLLLDWAD